MVTVTVSTGAVFWSNGMEYQAGDTLDVRGIEAERGKYHGVFDA